MKMFLKNDAIWLRALEPTDVPFLYAMENDASVWNAGSNIQPFSAASLRNYVENQQGDLFADKQLRLVVCLAGVDTPVGLVDLYDFSPRHLHACGCFSGAKPAGKGYCQNGVRLVGRLCVPFPAPEVADGYGGCR